MQLNRTMRRRSLAAVLSLQNGIIANYSCGVTSSFVTTTNNNNTNNNRNSPLKLQTFIDASKSSSYYSTSSTILSSSFKAPTPPSFTGQPIFPDVEIGSSSSSSSNTMSEVARERNRDVNAIFVVTGASRGIGLEMVKSLIDRTEGTILACCRSILPPTSTSTKNNIHTYIDSIPKSQSDRIHVLPLDLTDQSSINHLAQTIHKSYGDRVDVLFNVAGILGDGGKTNPGPERSLRSIDRDWMRTSMEVNYIGPVMLCQALAPMMKKKKKRQQRRSSNNSKSSDDGSATDNVAAIDEKSVIVNLSARVGSISDNNLGGWHSYRCSKTALNQATRTMGHELKRQGTWTIALHPGTTDTDLSKPFQSNVQEGRLFPVEFTVEQLMRVVEGMEERHSGGFYDWAGKALPF